MLKCSKKRRIICERESGTAGRFRGKNWRRQRPTNQKEYLMAFIAFADAEKRIVTADRKAEKGGTQTLSFRKTKPNSSACKEKN